MVNGPKHCSKLNDSTFTKFIETCKGNSGSKSLSEWYAKSHDCLLTHSLPATSILFLIETIYSNIFRCNYLRSGIYFLNFCFSFNQFRFNFKQFQKKHDPHSHCIFELMDPEKRPLNKCLKSPLSEDPWVSNMVNGPKQHWNLKDSTFTIFIDPCEDNSGLKSLSELYAVS